jgi:phage tail sheath gpL-like
MILFESIPNGLLVPGVYTEANDKRASSQNPAQPRRLLLAGGRLSTGEVTTGIPYRVFNPADAERCSGVGSHIAEMAHVVKDVNQYLELWAVALDDHASGVPATCTATCAAVSAKAGTVVLYVSSYWVGSTPRGRYEIAVTVGMTASALAAAIVAAVNADPYRLVQASNADEVVTLTARNDGTQGNSLVCSHSLMVGEKLPSGVTLTITAFADGASNPAMSTPIAAMGDAHTSHLAQVWTDATNMTASEAEMLRRWGGTVQRECHLFSGVSGSLGTLTTFGDSRNSQFSSVIGTGLSPTPPWIAAAQLAAVDAGMAHPGKPLRGKLLPCMFAPAAGLEFDGDDRQQLLSEGISTYTVSSDGKCYVERLVTTYQEDVSGNPDSKYRDRQVPGLIGAIRYDWRNYIGPKYGAYMHASDASVYDPGNDVVSPSTIRAEFAGRARNVWMRQQAWIENVDQFEEDIVIERTEDGMDMIGVPDLINRLHVMRTRFDWLR